MEDKEDIIVVVEEPFVIVCLSFSIFIYKGSSTVNVFWDLSGLINLLRKLYIELFNLFGYAKKAHPSISAHNKRTAFSSNKYDLLLEATCSSGQPFSWLFGFLARPTNFLTSPSIAFLNASSSVLYKDCTCFSFY